MLIPVIIAGGNGTRLWPLSRESRPKQYLKVPKNESMLQSTLKRLSGLNISEPIVVCNQGHKELTYDQLDEIGVKPRDIILEPCGKNTAPAIALSAFRALKYSDEKDPILLVLPADHFIGNVNNFQKSVERATELAMLDKLVTFGIVPNSPETGYGYIQRGNSTINVSFESYDIKNFVEKPDYDTAINYINSGDFYWNSGMFIFRASVYLKELKKFRPDIYESCKLSLEHESSKGKSVFTNVIKEEFDKCPSESLDYAVMEHTLYGAVLPIDIDWSDVGSWSALWDISNKDSHNNYIKGDFFVDDSSNCYMYSEGRFVTAIGLESLVIVNTRDSLLIINKNDSQKVKLAVDYLKSNDRVEHKVIKDSECLNDKFKVSGMEGNQVYTNQKTSILCNEKIFRENNGDNITLITVLSGAALVKFLDREYIINPYQSLPVHPNVNYEVHNLNSIELIIIEVKL